MGRIAPAETGQCAGRFLTRCMPGAKKTPRAATVERRITSRLNLISRSRKPEIPDSLSLTPTYCSRGQVVQCFYRFGLRVANEPPCAGISKLLILLIADETVHFRSFPCAAGVCRADTIPPQCAPRQPHPPLCVSSLPPFFPIFPSRPRCCETG